MPRDAFAPGGRKYEKSKSQSHRRGGGRHFSKMEEEVPGEDAEKWRARSKHDEDDSEEDSSDGSGSGSEKSGSGKEGEKGEKGEKAEKKKAEKPKDKGKAPAKKGDADSDSSEEEPAAPAGSNPNRAGPQRNLKVSQLDTAVPEKRELTRREREELEKQRAKEAYMKKHLAGQTEEAKKDLERLALIRKQREEAARKRDEEIKAREQKKVEARK
eukprot:tig00000241_g20966.t1